MAQTPKGRAIIEVLLDSTKLEKQLRAVEDNFKRVGANILKVGAGFTGFGAGLLGALTIAANEAGDAAEIFSRFEAVFKGASKEVRAFAQEVAKSIGRTESDVLDALSSYQSFFIGLGKGEAEARELSKTLSVLALDFASFNNLSDDDAQSRFLAGLSGSSEVFDKYGINIKAAALNQEFLKQGLDKTTATASENEKVMARLAIIMESLGKQGAVGDAVRTADSYNNVLKRLSASFTELKQAIGDAVTKDLASFNSKMAQVINNAKEYIRINPGIITAFAALGAASVALGIALSALGVSFIGLGAAVAATSSIVGFAVSAWGILAGVAVAAFAALDLIIASLAIGIGLIIADIAGLTTKFVSLAKSVKGDFNQALHSARNNFDLLKAAVLSGDLELAFKVLAKSAELFFKQSFNSILQTWDGFVADISLGAANIVADWKKSSALLTGYFIDIAIIASKVADDILNVFNSPLTTIENLFIRVMSRIQMLWVEVKGLIEAGISILSDRDFKGAKEALKDITIARDRIKKTAEAKIAANIKLDANFEVSDLTKELEQRGREQQDNIKSILTDFTGETDDIINNLIKKTEGREDGIQTVEQEIRKLGLQFLQGGAKQEKEKEKEIDDKKTVKAIKSIAPQFGSLVETGSSAALKLFASNQNPMVKEQQKTNKALGIIADNTAGLTTV